MTTIVCLSGGGDAIIENGFMAFKNQYRNYPIREFPDDVERVAYKTGHEGWMDSTMMS